MRVLNIVNVLPLIILISCTSKTQDKIAYSLRDTVAIKYLQSPDHSETGDTFDTNFKILKAYINNDTISLRKILAGIEQKEKYKLQWKFIDSCIQQIKVQDLQAEEAYRFIYSGAFCTMKQITTIYKNGDSISLNFALYQEKWDSLSCSKLDEYNKKITKQNWNDIIEKLNKGDFWGLKAENGVSGLDGSTLTVIGFVREDTLHHHPMKYNYVYRWSYSTLSEAFELVTKISGNKEGCLQIR